MKKISIVSPCYNEEQNVEILYRKTKEQFELHLGNYQYEHIFIDNASTDNTVAILKKMAAADSRIKIIVNARNFGHIRSPFYGLLQADGDAVMLLVSDLQDPPELIPSFVQKWEEGYKITAGVKVQAEESSFFFFARKTYYNILDNLSEVRMIRNYTGFGLYDKSIIELLKSLNDPYPFLRGLICEFGFEKAIIPYKQPLRKRGITKNNFYTLYDIGILGLTSHSKKLLRLVTLIGFLIGIISFFVSVFYFIYKLVYWDSFTVGIAPVVFGLFFFSSVQLFFLGIIGEYIGNIYTKIMNRPIVVENERINF